MDKGQHYVGPITIVPTNEGKRSDPKAFYYSSAREALMAESSSWRGERVPFTSLAGETFNPPLMLPKAFADDVTGSKAHYFTINAAQFKAWQYALSEHSEIRETRPELWINNTFGSLERFNEIFRHAPANLTREQYYELLPHGTRAIENRISKTLTTQNAASVAILETLLQDQGSYQRDARAGMKKDGTLSEQKALPR